MNINDELKNETANGTKLVLGKVCPNCKIKLSTGYLSDARSGSFLVDVIFDFYQKCLYIGNADVTKISR